MVAHIRAHRVSLAFLDEDPVLLLLKSVLIVVDQRLEQGRHFRHAFHHDAHVLLQGLEWRFAKQGRNRVGRYLSLIHI